MSVSLWGLCLVCMPVGQCLPTRHGKGKMILPNNTSCVYPVGKKLGGEKVVREKFRWGKKGDFGPIPPFSPNRVACTTLGYELKSSKHSVNGLFSQKQCTIDSQN